MNYLIIIFSIIFTSSSFCAEEEMPEEAALAKTRYLERVEELENTLEKDITGRYLFHREGECPGSRQDPTLSNEVFSYIQRKQTEHVSFNYWKLDDSVGGHTCTAMALDFLARYHAKCAKETNPARRKRCVKDFKPYLSKSNTTFNSRQAAFNTIELKNSWQASSDQLKQEKIQSLANFHNFTITPVTGTIKTHKLYDRSVDLRSTIDGLPDGSYIVRMLHPANNVKGEYFGHTMIFIKDKDLSIYYDNSRGPLEVTQDLWETIREVLMEWGIEEFRIYHALPPTREVNLRNDTCQSRSLPMNDEPLDDADQIEWED